MTRPGIASGTSIEAGRFSITSMTICPLRKVPTSAPFSPIVNCTYELGQSAALASEIGTEINESGRAIAVKLNLLFSSFDKMALYFK